MFDLTRRDPNGARESVAARLNGGVGDIELHFDKAYTLAQVAEKLSLDVRQIQKHIDRGHLVAVDVGCGTERRNLRILDEDLEGFARRRKTGAVPAVDRAPRARSQPSAVESTFAARRAARLAAAKS